VGGTRLLYDARAITDLHARLREAKNIRMRAR
jgi:hypothetical protein